MEVTDSSNEKGVVCRRLEVDNRQLVHPVHGKQVDFPARMTRQGSVDAPQTLLESSLETAQDTCQGIPADVRLRLQHQGWRRRVRSVILRFLMPSPVAQ